MKRQKWLYGSVFIVLMGVNNAIAQPSLGLPWKAGEIWEVVRGYHGSVGGVYGVDLKPTANATGAVVASADGTAYARENAVLPCEYNWKSPSRTLRIDHGNGWETAYTHVVDFSVLGISPNGPGALVRKGQIIGYRGDTGCTTGPHLDFTLLYKGIAQPIPGFEGKRVSGGASPILASGGYNYADQYLSFNKATFAHLPGTLIQAKGESKVYLVDVDEWGRIVKRWIVSESVFYLNGFDWRRIVEIALADKTLYVRGDDITSKVTVDGLIEGELVRVKGDTIKVYVVSAGQLHHLAMSAAEFSLLGYSFSQIREVDDVYAKGKEITYSAFVSCFASVLAGIGTTLTEVKGSTNDPRRYDKDPLVLFHAKSVIV